MPVPVAKPLKHMTVDWDRFTARFAAVDEVIVRARVPGYLQEIHFEEGAMVEVGQLLFVIDERPYQAARAEALAGLEQARASVVQAEAMRVQALAEVTQAEAETRLAETRLKRATEAMSTNAISREEVDVRESERAQSAAALAAAQAAVAAADAAIATAKAGIATAEARLESAVLNLGYCRIQAPIAGRIGRRLVTQGNLIQGEGGGAATDLARIVSLDPIHCYFDASESELLKYTRLARTGQRGSSRDLRNPVRAKLLDEQGYPHIGHTDFVDARVETSTGTIQGRAIFRNPDGLFTPGLFAVLRLPGSARYEAILVPDEAIQPDQSGRYVLAIETPYTPPPGMPMPTALGAGGPPTELAGTRRIPVTLGPMVRGLRVIRSGLTGDETILISGLMRAFPGAPVIPVPGEIKLGPDSAQELPDDYAPLPESEWIRREGERPR